MKPLPYETPPPPKEPQWVRDRQTITRALLMAAVLFGMLNVFRPIIGAGLILSAVLGLSIAFIVTAEIAHRRYRR